MMRTGSCEGYCFGAKKKGNFHLKYISVKEDLNVFRVSFYEAGGV